MGAGQTAGRSRVALRRRARGQALALGLVLLVAAAAGLFFVFRTGQLVSDKARLLNAADAAALAAAGWRARALNFAAYANRAIVVQEVAAAQAVTLVSWSRYFARLARNAAQVSQIYPPVWAVLEQVAQAAEAARDLTELTAQDEMRWRNAPDAGYKALLQASQEVLVGAAGGFGASAIANEVARANDARYFAHALPDGGRFAAFTRRYDRDADRNRLADVVQRSLDAFTAGPRGVDLILWGVPTGCALGSISPADWFQMLRKRGGTVLSPGLERWEAADTLSLHDNRRSGFLFGRCRRVEALPLGWGAAEASSEQAAGRLLDDPGGTWANPSATQQASDELGERALELAYDGIARVREIDFERQENDRFPTSRIAILARAEPAVAPANPAIERPAGRLRPAPDYDGGRLWALAVGEVYFRKPPGESASDEYASLYSPYWQARLAAPTPDEFAQAQVYAN